MKRTNYILSTFCVAAAGFRPRNPFCDAIFLPAFSTPTLHILGRTDVIVVEERSKTLLEVSANKRVEYHDGGAYEAAAYRLMSIVFMPVCRAFRPVEGELA